MLHALSYQSRVVQRDPADAGKATDAAMQIELTGANTGTPSGYTTMVYEPYNNGTQGSTTWKIHDVLAGKVWSSHSLTTGDCTQAVPCPYSVFESHNPTAKIGDVKLRLGQNSGVGSVGLDVLVDDVRIDLARYDLGG